MSLNGLLNQTITIYSKSGYDAYGRPSVGSGSDVEARFQPKSIRKIQPNGDVLAIDAIAYVNANADVVTDDKISFNSQNYRVLNVYPVPDKFGNVHHHKLELLKWQM